MILNSLGAGAVSPWTMLQDDVSKIQRTSPNEFAKTWLGLKKQSVEDLKEAIWHYQQNHVVVGVINFGSYCEGPPPVPAYVNGPGRDENGQSWG